MQMKMFGFDYSNQRLKIKTLIVGGKSQQTFKQHKHCNISSVLLGLGGGLLLSPPFLFSRPVFILCGTERYEKDCILVQILRYRRFIQLPCSNSDNSEYHFVFAVLPKYYLHYNIPLAAHNHHPQHNTQQRDEMPAPYPPVASTSLSLWVGQHCCQIMAHSFLLVHARLPLVELAPSLLVVVFLEPFVTTLKIERNVGPWP
jgi:hypothetical protein